VAGIGKKVIITVSQEGSGDIQTISEALNNIPPRTMCRFRRMLISIHVCL